MSGSWTRDDLPEFRGLLNALTDDDPDSASRRDRLKLSIVLDAVVRHLNFHHPKNDADRGRVEVKARELAQAGGIDFDEQEPEGVEMLIGMARHVLGQEVPR